MYLPEAQNDFIMTVVGSPWGLLAIWLVLINLVTFFVFGLDKLKALHLNDSKNPYASHKDRHELLGQGSLGLETFHAIVNHPVLSKLPMILETPNELPGYKAEIAVLRKMAGSQ